MGLAFFLFACRVLRKVWSQECENFYCCKKPWLGGFQATLELVNGLNPHRQEGPGDLASIANNYYIKMVVTGFDVHLTTIITSRSQ